MDQSVIDAIAKWPNVPACTGWLLLDRRGQWRMRDDACQAAGELGDLIRHVALKAFIERNYGEDEAGRWFFQNGPQRVFVDLAYTPLVLRLHAASTTATSVATAASPAVSITPPLLTDQCGRPFDAQAAWIDDAGNVLFSDALPDTTSASSVPGKAGGNIALLHDHDLALFSEYATLNDEQAAALSEEQYGAPAGASWQQFGTINWSAEKMLPLLRIRATDVASHFAYAPRPAL